MDKNTVKSKMDNCLSVVSSDIGTIRTGRATPSLVEDIIVAAYGGAQKMRIMELGTITVPDPQTIIIEPWDKTVIGEIRQGILAANVGFNPAIDGQIVRISLPPLTAEDRQKYVKLLHTKLEQGRITIRQVRADAMKDVKQAFEAKTLTEDDKFREEKELQDMTDEYVGKIDEIGKLKEKELLQI